MFWLSSGSGGWLLGAALARVLAGGGFEGASRRVALLLWWVDVHGVWPGRGGLASQGLAGLGLVGGGLAGPGRVAGAGM